MNQPIEISFVLTTVAAMTGLAVWMVKHSETRTARITDTFLAHLEERSRRAEETNRLYATNLGLHTAEIVEMRKALAEQANQLREVTIALTKVVERHQ